MYICMYVHVCLYICNVYMYACMYVYMHIYMHIYMHFNDLQFSSTRPRSPPQVWARSPPMTIRHSRLTVCLTLWILTVAYRFCFGSAPVNMLVPATSLLWAL